jgi:RimJ/RimL family protein N-acetyltransferase
MLKPLLEMTPKEWGRFHSYFRDREIAEWNGSHPIRMPLWLFKRVVIGEERGGERVGMGIYSNDVFIGSVEFYELRPTRPRQPTDGTLGIVIGEKQYWGQGYGTAALRVALRYAFTDLGLERIRLETLEYNHRARHAFEKVGFILERVVEQGGGHRYAHYSIDRRGWERTQSPSA